MPTINGDEVFNATVLEVHSGDDLMLMVDLNMDNLYKKMRVRLKGCDTPDAYKSALNSEAGRVRKMVQDMVKNKPCKLIRHSQSRNSWMITLLVCDKAEPQNYTNVNDHLIGMGYVFEKQTRSESAA
jgi:hypothetical protein